ncbi:hypothetical protein BKA82DRAFT_999904, partial [Pisolithus tinctorius]
MVHDCFGQFLRAFELARRTSSLPAAAVRRISCNAFSMAATSNCRLLKTSGISDAEVMCSNWHFVAGVVVCIASACNVLIGDRVHDHLKDCCFCLSGDVGG